MAYIPGLITSYFKAATNSITLPIFIHVLGNTLGLNQFLSKD